jgi:hypothetical protein
VDQKAALILAEEAVQAVYDLENRGLPFNRTPEGASISGASADTPAISARRCVKRACYAADRTGHMILQTLYQQCIKNEVFFDEFQVVDLILEGTIQCARAWWRGTGHRGTAHLRSQSGHCSPPAVSAACSRSPPTPMPTRAMGPAGLRPAGHPPAGHGVLPVSSHRHQGPGHSHLRSGAR